MAEQGELFHEDIYDAFRHAVKVLGGAKKAGSRLWPDKPVDQAAQLLLHCLNPDRPEKLDLYQTVWLLREANKKGSHIAMQKLCMDTNYADPTPINPEDERDQLMREYVSATESLRRIADRLENINEASQPIRLRRTTAAG